MLPKLTWCYSRVHVPLAPTPPPPVRRKSRITVLHVKSISRFVDVSRSPSIARALRLPRHPIRAALRYCLRRTHSQGQIRRNGIIGAH
ncbi:hypothetical protein GWI33_008836 [Rhynchophorus ferrugineus]|uniref:Uncharacterized protein n=1 Tax=Rhynchophorus ferrugineus TaxID=354439 RepID=A0A834IQA2_RHYFE|nr:hypothetical protein GWI33_008836 [Rhynchophorus ferrugineus]